MSSAREIWQSESDKPREKPKGYNTSPTLFKLNTGAEIPGIGIGTWLEEGEQANAVAEAIKAGCRHIDGARVYKTEPMIAEGIKLGGVPRSELSITSKLWKISSEAELVEPALDAGLKDLQTDYVDLYLKHYPCAFKAGDELRTPKDGEMEPGTVSYIDTWKAMEKLLDTGEVSAIGISNFSKAELEHLLRETTVVLAVH